MVSELEKQIRARDDTTKTIFESARTISEKIGSNFGTVRSYLCAKRKGFSSHYELLQQNARNSSQRKKEKNYPRKGFNSSSEYTRFCELKRGFSSSNENRRYLKTRQTYNEPLNEWRERMWKEKFYLRGLETNKTQELDNLNFQKWNKYIGIQKVKALTKLALNSLDKREKTIIKHRYFQGKTLEEIGKILIRKRKYCGKNKRRLTKSRVQQIEANALKKMRKTLDPFL